MNTFEILEDEACRVGIDVIHYDFQSENIKGLYCDGVIGLNKKLETTAEKSCVLAEELGHHYTSIGNILNQNNVKNRKQEFHARLWAYNKQIGLLGLVRAYEHGCCNAQEICDFLDVTEEFLFNSINCYRSKYGVYTTLDNYIIYFVPNLQIGKLTD